MLAKARCLPSSGGVRAVNCMNNPLEARESTPVANNRGGIAGWIRQCLSSAIVVLLLGGIAVWGSQTDWHFVRHSTGNIAANDWDALHDLPRSECVECNPALMARLPEHGWCGRHGIFDCPYEHPEIAQVGKTPTVTDAELQRVDRALRLRPRRATIRNRISTMAESSSPRTRRRKRPVSPFCRCSRHRSPKRSPPTAR